MRESYRAKWTSGQAADAKHLSFFLRSILLILLALLVPSLVHQNLLVHQLSGETTFTFAASGDLGVSDYSNSSLILLSSIRPSFFLALGDLSYEAAQSESTYCEYVTSRIGTSLPFEILSGNHEDGTEQHNGIIDNFAKCLPDKIGMTGSYGKEYYFDYPAQDPIARFIMISPGLSFAFGGAFSYTIGSPHYVWLSNAIDDARAHGISWVIVGMHKVCITMGEHTCEVGPDVMNLLLSKRVDMILEGHEHNYQRSKQLTCIGYPTLNTPSLFDPSCVANAGETGTYAKGAGTVIVISGTFGGGAPSPVNGLDPEAPYFATGMGDIANIVHHKSLGYLGQIWNSNMTGTGEGFVQYTLSASRLNAQLLLSSQITMGALFSDRFSISRIEQPSAPTRSNPSTPSAILAGSPIEGYLVLGVLALPVLYPAIVYFRETRMWRRFKGTGPLFKAAAAKREVSVRIESLGRRVRRQIMSLLALVR